jgi:hypothetical protein
MFREPIEEVATKIKIIAALALGAALLIPQADPAQVMIRKDQPDTSIDTGTSKDVIEGLLKELKAAYVFPETPAKKEADLRKRLDKNEYEEIKSAKKLAEVLTEHLQAISKDKHLRVFYSYDPVPEPPKKDAKPSSEKEYEMRERMRQRARSMNLGFEKAERLDGNVGYLDLRMFAPAELGGETAAAAMNLLGDTDALIIDVRKNGGGGPSMVALVCSFLFGPEPVHLNDLYFRPEDSTHHWWTLPHVPGKRYEGKQVFVLTSNRTFSAAEEFTYNLKSMRRDDRGRDDRRRRPSRRDSEGPRALRRLRPVRPGHQPDYQDQLGGDRGHSRHLGPGRAGAPHRALGSRAEDRGRTRGSAESSEGERSRPAAGSEGGHRTTGEGIEQPRRREEGRSGAPAAGQRVRRSGGTVPWPARS